MSSFREPSSLNELVLTMVPPNDGSGDLYAGGSFTVYNDVGVNYLARLQSDGGLHPATVRGSGFSQPVYAMETGPNGRVYVASRGFYNGTPLVPLVRVLPTGALDPTFQFSTLPQDQSFLSSGQQLARVQDGSDRLYVSSTLRSYGNQPAATLMRLFPDGTLDRSFATGTGFQRLDPKPVQPTSTLVAPGIVTENVPGGMLYAFGGFNRYNDVPVANLVRLRPDGTLDPSFALGTDLNIVIQDVVVADDGSGALYVSGTPFSPSNGVTSIVRLTATGQRDTRFRPPTPLGSAKAPTRDGTGGLYIATETGQLVKARNDGTVDPSFTAVPLPGFPFQVVSFRDGRVGAVGDKNITDGAILPRGYVLRVDQSGALDPTFVADPILDTTVYSMKEASDGTGDLYIGGAFSRYQTQTMQGLARLSVDGRAK